jgi:hypothetical protein
MKTPFGRGGFWMLVAGLFKVSNITTLKTEGCSREVHIVEFNRREGYGYPVVLDRKATIGIPAWFAPFDLRWQKR